MVDWIVGGLLVLTVYKIHMLMHKIDTTTIRESRGKKHKKE